jgi:hypothetical protein
MAVAFQSRLNIDFEIQIDDRAEQPGGEIQKDDGIGETRGWDCSESTEERIGLRVGWRTCRQSLMRNRANQGDRDQAVQN